MENNILEILKEEHIEILQLINRIERTQDLKTKAEVFEEVKQKIYAHMEAEELTLYENLKKQKIDNAFHLAEDAEFEHRQIKDSFEILEGLEFNSEDWVEMFQDIKSSIEEHVEFEESTLFAEAKVDFSTGQLLHFSKNYLETKDRSLNL